MFPALIRDSIVLSVFETDIRGSKLGLYILIYDFELFNTVTRWVLRLGITVLMIPPTFQYYYNNTLEIIIVQCLHYL